MPAPQTASRSLDTRPALGHVNLMVDTFIANANADDLRSIVRNLLATNPPHFAHAFTTAARSRLRQTTARASINPYALFVRQSSHTGAPAGPTPHLHDVLTRARSLYGAGMGFTSLNILASIVRASVGLRWDDDDGDLAALLAVIDADIGQAIQASGISSSSVGPGPDPPGDVRRLLMVDDDARFIPIQSSKEEIEGGRVNDDDFGTARAIVDDLRKAVKESMADVAAWGGEFPFERAASSLDHWKI
ncbi:hypothetical protein D9615_007031 [Tricholomella constricta]|uniref:Uncharacterized protein n=1 Tax=Tricholomella constricta TaxID=117010 RepID=A0A8H5H8A8_9AGAR|nr:hypothetical protein D9615_007031 [Tricholomella constricta]